MLTVNSLIGFGAGVKPPKTILFNGGVADLVDRTVYTFTSGGSAKPTRLFVVALAWTGNVTLVSATIAGIAATIHVQALGVSTTFRGSALISALISATPPFNIIFTLSGGATNGAIETWNLFNVNNIVPFHVNSIGTLTGAVASTTLNIPEGGAAFGAASMSSSAPTNPITWSGLTRTQTEAPYETTNASSGAETIGLAAQTARPITATVNGGSTPRGSLCVASWD